MAHRFVIAEPLHWYSPVAIKPQYFPVGVVFESGLSGGRGKGELGGGRGEGGQFQLCREKSVTRRVASIT